MTQFYFEPKREPDPHSLPDGEVFWADEGELSDEEGQPLPAGWYWWCCFPGCLPDSDPIGPFETVEEALANARDEEALS